MRIRSIVLVALTLSAMACGPAVRKYYYASSTVNNTTYAQYPSTARNVTITLYNEQGQPVQVQPASANVSVVVSSTVILYTKDGTPVIIYTVDPKPDKGGDHEDDDDKGNNGKHKGQNKD